VKKLHVSLPDPEQPDIAKELLEAIALVSGGRTEDIVQVVEKATVWLSEQPELSVCLYHFVWIRSKCCMTYVFATDITSRSIPLFDCEITISMISH
jgi:intergrase/recombinase